MARSVNAAAVKAGYAQKARGSLGAAGEGTSRCGLGPRLTRDRVGDPGAQPHQQRDRGHDGQGHGERGGA